ncbi:MAG: co-chaperone GroES [Planctomycetia bacterium]|nr:co-chaperone GroES [Planctomycetia bacterium]
MAKKKSECSSETKQCCGMKLQPLGDRVVIRRDESEERTAGGLYLPETAKNKPARGTVISIGDGRILEDGSRSEFTVQEGDRVIFLSYAGEDFKFGEDEYLLMRESDILAIIN